MASKHLDAVPRPNAVPFAILPPLQTSGTQVLAVSLARGGKSTTSTPEVMNFLRQAGKFFGLLGRKGH